MTERVVLLRVFREKLRRVRFLKAALYPDKMKFTCEWSCRMRDYL
ncbi:hypothetical protein [Ruminococcus sp.]